MTSNVSSSSGTGLRDTLTSHFLAVINSSHEATRRTGRVTWRLFKQRFPAAALELERR